MMGAQHATRGLPNVEFRQVGLLVPTAFAVQAQRSLSEVSCAAGEVRQA